MLQYDKTCNINSCCEDALWIGTGTVGSMPRFTVKKNYGLPFCVTKWYWGISQILNGLDRSCQLNNQPFELQLARLNYDNLSFTNKWRSNIRNCHFL